MTFTFSTAAWSLFTLAGKLSYASASAGVRCKTDANGPKSESCCRGTRHVVIASRGGCAGTIMRKCGRLPRGAHPIRALAATSAIQDDEAARRWEEYHQRNLPSLQTESLQ